MRTESTKIQQPQSDQNQNRKNLFFVFFSPGKFCNVYYIEWRDKLIFPKFSIFKNIVFFFWVGKPKFQYWKWQQNNFDWKQLSRRNNVHVFDDYC